MRELDVLNALDPTNLTLTTIIRSHHSAVLMCHIFRLRLLSEQSRPNMDYTYLTYHTYLGSS